MSDPVTLLDPNRLEPNPDNPRLIFREDELVTLVGSIAKQGILVPLTVYQEGRKYKILDGERRWRCSLRLGLTRVPVIVQPKPDRMTNLMMMFAIHNARKDWDPLPTALKLEELESEFRKRQGVAPTELELAGIASIPRGEVRRLKKLLKLPSEYRVELMEELAKPRSAQILSVDHVIEAGAAADSLEKKKIISSDEVEPLRRAIVEKFKSKVIDNTVAPRKFANLARAVERKEISIDVARQSIKRFLKDPKLSIDQVYATTVEQADFEHSIEQLAERLRSKLMEAVDRRVPMSAKVVQTLEALAKALRKYV